MKMKVLLLEHPRARRPERCNDIANTPLSSCLFSGYVAATLLKEGHEAEIIEGYLEGLSYGQIRERVLSFAPDIIGVHMVYNWAEDLELARFLSEIKRQCQPRYIAAYGYYPTFAFMDIPSLFQAVDGVIAGEPELTFRSLASEVCRGGSLKNKNIPGLVAAADGGEIKKFPSPQVAPDLDSLPFPFRTQAMLRLPEVNLLGSRGCYGRCSFCHLSSFWGSWRGRSPENIVAEIDLITGESGARDFYFTDPNFFGPGASGQQRALRLACLLGPRKIRFGMEARVNDIKEDTIRALAGAGLRQILLGLESGRDESLKRMGKMTTVRQGEEALRILRRHGIEPNVGFIMFEPCSTLEDVRENFEFLKRNKLLENLAVTANVLNHPQILLKGTKAFFNEVSGDARAAESEGRSGGASPYEVEARFKTPEVGDLAFIMRRAANFLFVRMDGIWSGRVLAPAGALERYRRINGFFVDLFESTLERLASDGRLGPGGAERLALQAEEDILKLLPSEYLSEEGRSFLRRLDAT